MGDSEAAQCCHQLEIEIRKVDRDKDVRAQVARSVDQLAQHRKRARNNLDRFGKTGDGERAIVPDEATAGGLQPGTAKPEDLSLGHPPPQLGRQCARIHVA